MNGIDTAPHSAQGSVTSFEAEPVSASSASAPRVLSHFSSLGLIVLLSCLLWSILLVGGFLTFHGLTD